MTRSKRDTVARRFASLEVGDARPPALTDDEAQTLLVSLAGYVEGRWDPVEARAYAEHLALQAHATRWTEQRGKALVKEAATRIVKRLGLPSEPEPPPLITKWVDAALTGKKRKRMPREVEAATAVYHEAQRAWLEAHKRTLYDEAQLLVLPSGWYLAEREVPGWVLEGLGLIAEAGPALPDAATWPLLRSFSMVPAQTVDRAARGTSGWQYPENAPPRFEDPRNAHAVEYVRDGVSLEKLREGVMHLNPRTADVWRLVTAASLEAWQEGQLEPPAVWVDVRDLLGVMGYTKHHKGGYKQEDLSKAAQALADLDSFHIVIPYGAKLYPHDPRTGKRRKTKLEAVRTYKVLTKAATDELRDLFGNRYPMRWLLKPGEWIKSYPRHYAPLYRAIVELPAKPGKPTWAKAIGTELSYQYRQDRDRRQDKKLKVATLLERACLLEEARSAKNKKRVREYFEGALDLLEQIGVCEGWEYAGRDIDPIERTKRGWFDLWLEVHVVVTAPAHIVAALPKLTPAPPL